MTRSSGVARYGTPAEFLDSRGDPLETECAGPDFTITFAMPGVGVGEDALSFSVSVERGRASVSRPACEKADHVVFCTAAEFLAVVNGHAELLGPFWGTHLPVTHFDWAPALYAFLFPQHPYVELTPTLRHIYRDPRYYPTVTPFPQGYTLYTLALEHDLHRTLEVGLAFAGSALFLLSAHAQQGQGTHTALDPFQDAFFGGRGLELVRESGLDGQFVFHPVTSMKGMRDLDRDGEVFDLVYIDGDHSLSGVLADFFGANALLRKGGLLAFDDSHLPSGRRALQVIANEFDYAPLTESSTDRLTVLRKRDHRSGRLALRLRVAAANRFRRTREVARARSYGSRREDS